MAPTVTGQTSRVTGQRRRSQRSHEAILKAATSLLEECGYNRVTVEAIAARAGSGKQTIYRWWPSKAFLFIELYRRLVPEAALAADSGSVGGDLRHLLTRLFAIYAQTPARTLLAGLVAEAQSEPAVARALQSELVERRRELVRLPLQRGIERGELRPEIDLNFTVDLISSLVWFRLLLGQAPLDRAFAEQAVGQILTGIAAVRPSS